MCTKANGLEYYDACWCAGTFCGGHLVLRQMVITGFTPIGWQGATQHTFVTACDGFHAPGPCPPPRQPLTIECRGC